MDDPALSPVAQALAQSGVRRTAPGIATTLLLGLVFYLLQILIDCGLQLLDDGLGVPERFLARDLGTWCVMLWLTWRIGAVPTKELFPLASISPRLVPGIVLASVGIGWAGFALASRIPLPEFVHEHEGELIAQPYHWAQLTSTVLLAPLAEELFFRGFVLRGFLARYPRRTAILASAALFGAFHLNHVQAIGGFPLGVLFAWLVLRTGSLWPAILGHAAVNGHSELLLGAYELAGGTVDESWIAQDSFWPWDLLVGAGVAWLGIALLRGRLRRSAPAP